MRLARVMAVLALGLTVAGCSGGGSQQQEFGKEDAEAIRKVAQDFVAAYNSKDPGKTTSFFSGAAVLMPPNSSTLRGADSIQGYFKQRFADGATGLTLEPRDLAGYGPIAYMSGTYSVKVVPPDGGPETRDRGKNLFIMRKLAGQWKYEYTIWSSDLPVPVPPAPEPAPSKNKKK